MLLGRIKFTTYLVVGNVPNLGGGGGGANAPLATILPPSLENSYSSGLLGDSNAFFIRCDKLLSLKQFRNFVF